MPQKVLLLDINETLDDAYNGILYDIHGKIIHNGLQAPRKDIEVVGEFLRENRNLILPIFWTSVGLIGQKFTEENFLGNAGVRGFDGNNFYEFSQNQHISEMKNTGIGRPKSRYIPKVIEYTGVQVQDIIWLEDSVRDEDDHFITQNAMTHIPVQGSWNPIKGKPDRVADTGKDIVQKIEQALRK